MTLSPLLAKDARLVLRHRALLAALVLYPFLLALTLGAAFSEPPARLDLVVVNHDRDGAVIQAGGENLTSADLVGMAAAFADVRNVSTEEEALAALRLGEADAALVIPPGFVRDLSELGGNATLRIVVDESDPVRAGVARSAVVGAVDAFLRAVVQKKIADVQDLLDVTVEGGTVRILFVDVNVLGLENARRLLQEVLSTLDSRSDEARKVRDVIAFLDFASSTIGNADRYLRSTALPLDVQTTGLASADTRLTAVALPGALVLGVFWTGALAAALLVARERETGVLRRLAAAPVSAGATVASKTLVAVAAALLPALALLALGILALGAVVQAPLLTLLALALAALAAAGVGALAAGLARASSAAALLAVLLLLPMLLLGGLFYPVAYMPAPAQAVARLLPVTLATDALRGAMIRGSGLTELWVPLVGLAAFAVVAGGLGAWLARRAP